jgi:hypothetical protein
MELLLPTVTEEEAAATNGIDPVHTSPLMVALRQEHPLMRRLRSLLHYCLPLRRQPPCCDVGIHHLVPGSDQAARYRPSECFVALVLSF